MQKRKNRIEQWRAERRTKLGIDKAMQQSIAQAAQVRRKNRGLDRFLLDSFPQGKAWSLEDEGDDDEDDLQNVVIPPVDLKRDVAAARESAMNAQAEKQREALERAAEAAALASAACTKKENADDDDEDDPLDKYMENISKEVKSLRGNNATIISTKPNAANTNVIKQEPATNNPKGSVIKIVTSTVKSQVRIEQLLKERKDRSLILFFSQLKQMIRIMPLFQLVMVITRILHLVSLFVVVSRNVHVKKVLLWNKISMV